MDGVLSWREQWQRGVSIGFTFLPHVIIPDKRNGVHWNILTNEKSPKNITFNYKIINFPTYIC
jgi:hypothetical protein